MVHVATNHTTGELIPVHNARVMNGGGIPVGLYLGILAHILALFGLSGFASGSGHSPARNPGAGLRHSIGTALPPTIPLISLEPNCRWPRTSDHRAEYLLPKPSPPGGPHRRGVPRALRELSHRGHVYY